MRRAVYITCLYSLIETCEYGTSKEEMLRDRLVVRMSGKMDPELTLERRKQTFTRKRLYMNNSASWHLSGVGVELSHTSYSVDCFWFLLFWVVACSENRPLSFDLANR